MALAVLPAGAGLGSATAGPRIRPVRTARQTDNAEVLARARIGVARAGQSHEDPVQPGPNRHLGLGAVGQRQRHRPVAVGEVVDLGRPLRRQQRPVRAASGPGRRVGRGSRTGGRGPARSSAPRSPGRRRSRPVLSSIRSSVVLDSNSGRSRNSANMWLARFSGHATRCNIRGSTSWSSMGALVDRRSPGPVLAWAFSRYCRVGLSRQMRMKVAVEYTLLTTKSTAHETDDAVRAARRRASRDRARFGRAEPDGGQQREHDDEVGQVAQRLRQLERGEPRRPHQVDRHLTGHRIPDAPPATPRRCVPCAPGTPTTTAASTAQPRTITAKGGVAHGDAGAQRCQSHGPPTRPGTIPWVTDRPQQIPRHAQVEAPPLLVDDDEVDADPRRRQRQRRHPEPKAAMPHRLQWRRRSPVDVRQQCGDGERDERDDRRLLEEQQTAGSRPRRRAARSAVARSAPTGSRRRTPTPAPRSSAAR